MNDDTWQLVKHTPRVSSFVGGKKDKPSSISKSDVDNILNRIEVVKKHLDQKHYLNLVKLLEFAMAPLMILMALSKRLIMSKVKSKFQFKFLVDLLPFN